MFFSSAIIPFAAAANTGSIFGIAEPLSTLDMAFYYLLSIVLLFDTFEFIFESAPTLSINFANADP